MLPIGQTIKNNYKAANIDSSEYISSGEARGWTTAGSGQFDTVTNNLSKVKRIPYRFKYRCK